MPFLISVSHKYKSSFVGGHFASFHTTLLQASQGLTARLSLAAPRDNLSLDDPYVDFRLASSEWQQIRLELSQVIQSAKPDGIVVYEGSLLIAESLVGLAQRFSNVRFVVNLHEPELPLHPYQASPNTRVVNTGRIKTLRSRPSNLILLAETPMRKAFADAAGLSTAGTWPVHSVFSDFYSQHERDSSKILALVAGWQISHPRVLVDLRQLARNLPRHMSLHVAGSYSRRQRLQLESVVNGRRVEKCLRPLAHTEYGNLLASATFAWLPGSSLYLTHSSGKALDSLVLGTVPLARAGTYTHEEARRWTQLPAFSHVDEALDLIRCTDTWLPSVQESLRQRQVEIRTAYGPDEAVKYLLNLVSE